MELSDINELQKTADYYASTKVVRGRWRTSVIIGVLGIVSGFFYSLIFSPINVVLILIGIFLVIVGIRARIVSRLSNLLYCGIALLAMGAWNIAVPISNVYIYFTSYTGSTMPLTLTWGFVLGFLCLGWAGENLSSIAATLPYLLSNLATRCYGKWRILLCPCWVRMLIWNMT